MKLRVLKQGSKRHVVLGFCCADPWSYSLWSEGTEEAFLHSRERRTRTDKVSRRQSR